MLSIILINHNAKDFTADCIQSIYDKTTVPFEIILVDNNSSDDSPSYIKEKFPQVRLIENKSNRGFATANNQGIKISKGKLLILLNNDTVLKNNALDKMFEYMDKNPEIGILACKLFDADGKTVQHNCRAFPSPVGTMFGRASLFTKLMPNNPISKRNLLLNWDYSSVKEADWVSGAALMVKREAIEQIGLLDENFYMYWEDTDFCKRAKDAGWQICFFPEAQIIHFTGKGGGKRNFLLSSNTIYQMHKSAYYYFRKYHLKSRLNPMTAVTFLGFIILTALKVALNSIKMAAK
jgi:GT2 family glycosyltransferase